MVCQLLDSDSPPDILRGRLVYDSAGDRRASDAENNCAVDIDNPDAENVCYGLGYLDTDEDADAVLAVDIEHCLCRNWQNISPFLVKIRLIRFFA